MKSSGVMTVTALLNVASTTLLGIAHQVFSFWSSIFTLKQIFHIYHVQIFLPRTSSVNHQVHLPFSSRIMLQAAIQCTPATPPLTPPCSLSVSDCTFVRLPLLFKTVFFLKYVVTTAIYILFAKAVPLHFSKEVQSALSHPRKPYNPSL